MSAWTHGRLKTWAAFSETALVARFTPDLDVRELQQAQTESVRVWS
jgi:hypothetical protein